MARRKNTKRSQKQEVLIVYEYNIDIDLYIYIDIYIYIHTYYMYIPGTWSFNPPKQGLFESKQWAPFGFQVHILYTSTWQFCDCDLFGMVKMWPLIKGWKGVLLLANQVWSLRITWCIFLIAPLYINFNYLAKWSYFTRSCEVAIIWPELHILYIDLPGIYV